MSISPQIRQKCLQLVNSVIKLRPLGVALSIEGKSEVLREPQAAPIANHFVVIDVQSKTRQISGREIAGEGAMAAVNCSAAIIAGIVTFSTVAAAPVTGGTSLVLTTVGIAATAATGTSCLNSGLRTYNAMFSPGRNQQWDEVQAYKTTLQVLDGVSLLGVGASAVATQDLKLQRVQ